MHLTVSFYSRTCKFVVPAYFSCYCLRNMYSSSLVEKLQPRHSPLTMDLIAILKESLLTLFSFHQGCIGDEEDHRQGPAIYVADTAGPP